MTRQPEAAPTLELEAIEDEAAWARATIAELSATPSNRRPPDGTILLWIAREVLRVEVALIARAGAPEAVDRLADARSHLAKVHWIDERDQDCMAPVAAGLERWAARAPGECDDALAFAATSSWWRLRFVAASTLRLDHSPSRALVERLARDGEDMIKRIAIERLRSVRELPYWKVAFSADPAANKHARALSSLAKPIAAVCRAYTPDEGFATHVERKARFEKAVRAYAAALDAMPDALLFDHASTVIDAGGALDARRFALLRALGARDGSLPLLHRALGLEGPSTTDTSQQESYFSRFAERSKRDRASALIAHLRWLHALAEDPAERRDTLLAHSVAWSKLWPDRAPKRAMFAAIVELASEHESDAVRSALESFGAKNIPRDMVASLLEPWSRGERSNFDRTYERSKLADALVPSERRRWVDAILRERRSVKAMSWALRQRTGELYSPKEHGPRPALVAKLCDDPTLRAAVLSDPTLVARCIEPLRAALNRGELTDRRALGRVVDVLRDLAEEVQWADALYAKYRGVAPRRMGASRHRQDAARFCADPSSLAPLSDREESLVRASRRRAFRAKDSAADRFDVELFSTAPWDADDVEDFVMLCEQMLDGDGGCDEEALACMIDHQWRPELRSSAERVLEALVHAEGSSDGEWISVLRERLGERG
ncbi:MAG: hypothetical protein JNK05_06410 [Myxococcales bacterium]|nr:hypothetical protein [Myxococcales bacterium]